VSITVAIELLISSVIANLAMALLPAVRKFADQSAFAFLTHYHNLFKLPKASLSIHIYCIICFSCVRLQKLAQILEIDHIMLLDHVSGMTCLSAFMILKLLLWSSASC